LRIVGIKKKPSQKVITHLNIQLHYKGKTIFIEVLLISE